MRIQLAIATTVLLAAACAGPAGASELYYCADGRILQVTSANRAALANDPCIKAWFATRQSSSSAASRLGNTNDISGPEPRTPREQPTEKPDGERVESKSEGSAPPADAEPSGGGEPSPGKSEEATPASFRGASFVKAGRRR